MLKVPTTYAAEEVTNKDDHMTSVIFALDKIPERNLLPGFADDLHIVQLLEDVLTRDLIELVVAWDLWGIAAKHRFVVLSEKIDFVFLRVAADTLDFLVNLLHIIVAEWHAEFRESD